jgi:cephalosporin hydroxylase
MIKTVEKHYSDKSWTNTYIITYVNNEIVQAPHDIANRHYQEILEWVANGGTIVDNGS